jgi:hypothetical protein
VGKVCDREDPAMIPRSRNWSSETWNSCSSRDLSMNVNDVGNSIDVMTLSTGHKSASLVE